MKKCAFIRRHVQQVKAYSAHRPEQDDWTAPLHPQTQAEQARSTWADLWAPAQLPAPEGFDQLRHLVGPAAEFPLPSVSGSALHSRFKATAKKSTGLDGWGAAAFVTVGPSAAEVLAQLWAACLQHEALPRIWKQIRVALLPKTDGGLRPISVASAAYRSCMTCLLRACRSWFLSWADPELVGGIPGRAMAQTHDALFSSLLEARSRHQVFVGRSQVLRHGPVGPGASSLDLAWSSFQACFASSLFLRRPAPLVGCARPLRCCPSRPQQGNPAGLSRQRRAVERLDATLG